MTSVAARDSYPETPSDFYNLSGPDLLAYCGADASKWSTAFCAIKEAQGWSAADIDESLMNTWFANAIEHSSQLRAGAQGTRPRDFLSWAVEVFGPVAKLRSERLLRFVEEAIELAHAEGMEREVFNRVADRVYSRPAGDTPKEIGQAQACLETFAENIGLSSAAEAQREWERVQSIPREEWARRHAAKQALGIALTSTEKTGAA